MARLRHIAIATKDPETQGFLEKRGVADTAGAIQNCVRTFHAVVIRQNRLFRGDITSTRFEYLNEA